MGRELDRPAVLTPEVQKEIVRLLGEGNYLAVACRAAGTTRQTFHYWKRLFLDGVEHAQVYAAFFEACDRALAEGETNALARLRTGRPGWQAAAWFLGRRYPRRWAARRESDRPRELTLPDIPDDEPDTEPRRPGEAEEGVSE